MIQEKSGHFFSMFTSANFSKTLFCLVGGYIKLEHIILFLQIKIDFRAYSASNVSQCIAEVFCLPKNVKIAMIV